MNLVIPMAGAGRRFQTAGFNVPKPFIDVSGRSMIERVLQNLWVKDLNVILCVSEPHLETYRKIFEDLERAYNVEIVPLSEMTDGPATTVAIGLRRSNIRGGSVWVANCDQLVSGWKPYCMLREGRSELDGAVVCFDEIVGDPKWSFAEIDPSGRVLRILEKNPISRYATVGVYGFKSADSFLLGYEAMLANSDKTNGEYYVGPLYNYLISVGANISAEIISKDRFFGIGIPEDLLEFQKRFPEDRIIEENFSSNLIRSDSHEL